MRRSEALALMATVAAAYPWMRLEDEAAALWAEQVRDLDVDVATAAVQAMVREDDRPSIARIRDRARAVAERRRPGLRALPPGRPAPEVRAATRVLWRAVGRGQYDVARQLARALEVHARGAVDATDLMAETAGAEAALEGPPPEPAPEQAPASNEGTKPEVDCPRCGRHLVGREVLVHQHGEDEREGEEVAEG